MTFTGASFGRPAMGGFRIYGSWEERLAREGHADVDRAIEVLGSEGGRISGNPRDLRRRWDVLLDELYPPPTPPTRREDWLRRLGFGARARAADAGLAALFGAMPVGVQQIGTQCGASAAGMSPEECMRSRIAEALDDAYCVLLPHEAGRRAELRRRFWASSSDEARKRDFIERCLGRRD